MSASKLPAVVGEADLAALLGIAPRTVRDAAKAGHVVRSGRAGYALVESVTKYLAHVRATVETRDSAVSRLRDTKNELAQLSLAERRRDLVPRAEAEEIIGFVIGAIHRELGGLPRRCARDPALIRTIDNEVTAAMNRVSDACDVAADKLAKG